MATAHTPGMWSFGRRYGDEFWVAKKIFGDDSANPTTIPIAHVFGRADAALIAAAPDQHAALKEVRDYIRHWQADVAGNLKPTEGSLERALASVEIAIAIAVGPSL